MRARRPRGPATGTAGTASGRVQPHGVRVAETCVEVSRFCLVQAVSPVIDDAVRRTLIDLDDGARGYRSIASSHGIIAVGDTVTIG